MDLLYVSRIEIEQARANVDRECPLIRCGTRLRRRTTPSDKNDALGKACAGSFQQQKVEYKARLTEVCEQSCLRTVPQEQGTYLALDTRALMHY